MTRTVLLAQAHVCGRSVGTGCLCPGSDPHHLAQSCGISLGQAMRAFQDCGDTTLQAGGLVAGVTCSEFWRPSL